MLIYVLDDPSLQSLLDLLETRLDSLYKPDPKFIPLKILIYSMSKHRYFLFGILVALLIVVVGVSVYTKPTETQKEVISDSPPSGYIKASVKDLQISSGGGVVLLGEDGSDRAVQIHIGLDQAHTLARVINNMSASRPMAHDLLEEIIKKTGTNISYISVDKLEAGTYYATIMIKDGGSLKLDARPSDSIIIAMKLGVPIYVNKDLLDIISESPSHPGIIKEEGRPA